MNKISVQNLNPIFNVIEGLSSVVSWVRDITFKKQLYVSDNYEKNWGCSLRELYENPPSFYDNLVEQDRACLLKHNAGIKLYRFKKLGNRILFIRDNHYSLTNEQGIHIGYLGFAQEVSEGVWSESLNSLNVKNTAENDLQKDVLAILQRELKIYSGTVDVCNKNDPIDKYLLAHAIKITARERDCLVYLLKGNVPKQIASLMNISIRTIEFHLESLKRKLGCRNTLQLISKISCII